jgi:pimeloyl-ACP methyl ester carboxylesterase/SAM-dependent methyltransferase
MERMISVNGIDLCVETYGRDGDPAIVLMAGSNSSMDGWDPAFCERLAAGPRFVVRYDYRDTGRSTSYPPGEPDYSGLDLARDVIGLLDVFGIDRAHLVGISMGGGLAQLTALEFADRVASLTLIATSSEGPGGGDLPPSDPALSAYFAGIQLPDWADHDAVVEFIVDAERHLEGPEHFDERAVRAFAERTVARTNDLAASQTNHLAARDAGVEPIRPRLKDIAVPTLVIHGSVDPLFPLPHGQALAAEIPDATLLVLDGVGHQTPPPSSWDTVVPAILRLSSGGWPQQADRLAALSIAAGDPTGWFDQLYAGAAAGEVNMPWDRGGPNQTLVDWLAGRDGSGRRAVVVGCGLGMEAGYAQQLGYRTTAFDISPTAVKLAQERNPDVDFHVADLFELPPEWSQAFDLVIEMFTVQALPRAYRERATRAVADLVAPGGTLYTHFAKLAEGDDPDDGPPWPLTRAELEAFADGPLEVVRIGELPDPPSWTYWQAEFRRP